MKVQIDKPFRSRKYKRIMQTGEVIDGTQEWAQAIVKEGLGTVIDANPVRKTKRINKKTVETAALEVNT